MTTARFRPLHGEAPLNWLAFGLLLAAWNAADNDPVPRASVARPDALRAYSQVTVRAAAHHRTVIKSST